MICASLRHANLTFDIFTANPLTLRNFRMLQSLPTNRGLLGQTPRNKVQADDEQDQQSGAPVTDGAKPSARAIVGIVLNRSSSNPTKLQCPEPGCEELFGTEEQLRKHLVSNIKKHGHCSLCSVSGGSQTKVNKTGPTQRSCQGTY